MRAWTLERGDGENTLELRDVEDPRPHGREVLIDVHAAGLNRADLLQIRGAYPGPDGRPAVPGLEFAGVVAAIGGGVERFFVGERVAGLVAQGAFADRIVCDERLLLPVPMHMDMAHAAALPECALTVYDALVTQMTLREGESLLAHSGSGGIGAAAIAIARALGARIAVTCSGAKTDAVRVQGPDLVIDHETEDWAEVVLEWTSGRGVDAILDTLGGEAFGKNLHALAPRGRMVTIGLFTGAHATVDLVAFLNKRIRWSGSVLRSRSLAEKAALVADFFAAMAEPLCNGHLDPTIHAVHPFAALPDALEAMRRKEHVGKLVIAMR